MKPLRLFHCVCRKPFPKIGEKLVMRDGVERWDYKYADWGSDFAKDFQRACNEQKLFGSYNDDYYPQAFVLTNQNLIVKAIIPIVQPKNREKLS